jgi:prepilin-type processing-associated H-X9-DG protein
LEEHPVKKVSPLRLAFSVIELVVVIGIIGVFIAILLPAVQRVRNAALRAQCSNNLHQIGLSLHQYHDTAGSFPAGMRFQNGLSPYFLMSWMTQLLPYIEQQNLWRQTMHAYEQSPNPLKNPPHIGLATVITTFTCPADPRVFQVQTAQREKLLVGLTSYLGVEGKDNTRPDGILFRDSAVRMAEITDGMSQTILVGERPPSTDFQYGWWYAGAGQKFTGSVDMVLSAEETNQLLTLYPSCPSGIYSYAPGRFNNQCDMFHFWSPHSGGALFLFADGSVHFIPYSAAALMPALASRNGGEVESFSD